CALYYGNYVNYYAMDYW
nr:immunoglobulin heavy chain junction region [Mus musculus]NSM05311.1 immunoglobulin heavy chain junction region [Mus musculus]NSM05421.1 immunoglobulin heavy chain junction region [Mus musculus]NSM05993.1 immunoglobulin heavy chain junction region [Mus musculus]NSM06346.1 immunoglobulin heavy chain junction region [Mus musculus]